MTTAVSTSRFITVKTAAIAFALLAAAAAIALLADWAAPLLNPQPEVRAALDPACDLSAGPCTSELPGGGAVTLSVAPRPIPVMTRIRIDVTLEGVEADAVEVDFAGVDMNMGFNRYTLTSSGDGRFTGVGVLPACVRNRMSWEATVLASGGRGLLAAPFRFDTVRP